jgi:prepilin-type N-terminal cleavage/methylation domain-containing protein
LRALTANGGIIAAFTPAMRNAFTLLELIIVMAAAAVIFSAAVSGFGPAKKRLELEASAHDAANALRLIRRKACASASPTEFEGELGGFELSRTDPVSNAAVKMSSKELPKGILFDAPVSFKFAASGFPLAGSSGTAVLRNASGTTKKIIVSSFGRIRIE